MDPENDNFCYFGKPLQPFDEDAFPKRKPIAVEDQIATDAQGRRRFHGAFTGGFSAGFFNTVGSLEGWLPSDYKSTRQEKAKKHIQNPEDFMDDEDLTTHGIAPRTIKATSDYSTSKKRTRQVFSEGPIPGEPVLHSLLTSGNKTIGYLLLKNIGFQDKLQKLEKELNENENRVYGCEMPRDNDIKNLTDKVYEIPRIYAEYLSHPKSNSFGAGYEGLNKEKSNSFHHASLTVRDKNKTLSIVGQAFGIGAFEDDDEDIYVKDDMSKYDFELTSEKNTKKTNVASGELIFEAFLPSKIPPENIKIYNPPKVPQSFTGKYKVRKSRFEPTKQEVTDNQIQDNNRLKINPDVRAMHLDEEVNSVFTKSKNIIPTTSAKKSDKVENTKNDPVATNKNDIGGFSFDRFVSASTVEDVSNILEPVASFDNEHGTKEMREAARMKMFGPLTRVTEDFNPLPLLCKRFNVPDSLLEKPKSKKEKRTTNLIFEYQKYNNDENLKAGISLPIKNEASTSSFQTPEDENVSKNVEEMPKIDEEAEKQPIKVEEIELQKDITEKVDVAQNLDLFKAIFMDSSSESEDEKGAPDIQSKDSILESSAQNDLKQSILSEKLIPIIKPIKEGILSNVDFLKIGKSDQEKSSNLIHTEKDCNNLYETKNEDVKYGPILPKQFIQIQKTNKFNAVCDEDDEWVEKDKKSKKKNKHKKYKKHSKKDGKHRN